MFRDPGWLPPLATWASSRNLGPFLLRSYVQFPLHDAKAPDF